MKLDTDGRLDFMGPKVDGRTSEQVEVTEITPFTENDNVDDIEGRRNKLRRDFRSFIEPLTFDFSTFDLDKKEVIDFYQSLDIKVLSLLAATLEKKFKHSQFYDKHTCLLFDFNFKTHNKLNTRIIYINLKEKNVFQDLEKAIDMLIALNPVT